MRGTRSGVTSVPLWLAGTGVIGAAPDGRPLEPADLTSALITLAPMDLERTTFTTRRGEESCSSGAYGLQGGGYAFSLLCRGISALSFPPNGVYKLRGGGFARSLLPPNLWKRVGCTSGQLARGPAGSASK